MSLKIVTWNANGLSQHTLEIQAYLKSEDIDILLVSETHFTKKSFIRIPNYKVYHTLHPDGSAHGGTAVIIKNKISHFEATHYCTNEIQATNIVVEDTKGYITMSAVYSPPKHNIKKDTYIAFFKTLGSRFIAGGDYNAKNTFWGSRLTTTKGRELYSALTNCNLSVTSTSEPTYWPTDRRKVPDLIDFFVTKGIDKTKLDCCSCLALSSDHSPVVLTLYEEPNKILQPCKLHNKYTDWDYFRSMVESSLNTTPSLKSDEEINEAVEHFITCIQKASWEATPVTEKNCHYKHQSKAIEEKILEKRRAKKLWQQTRFPEHKSLLNKVTKELKSLLIQENHIKVEKYLRNLDATCKTDYSLWKAAKKLQGSTLHNPPLRKQDNSWAKSDKEKSELFSNYLRNVFTQNECESEREAEINQFIEQIHQLEPPIKKIKRTELMEAISHLNEKKAPGYDLITGKVLKELPRTGINFLLHLFNACLQRNYFPIQWRVAEIKMISKPGKNPELTASYRPISLLSTPSKLLERLFLKKLMPIIEERRLIPTHQFGFRNQHGTIEQVHRLVEIIHSSFDQKKYCTAAFLDISQAFDRVWHQGLLYKLKKMLPINFYLFLRSYLSPRHFFVRHGNEISNLHEMSAGVPQGSVLGPLLYILFTADLPLTNGTIVGTFADDTAVLSVNKDPAMASESLQDALNNISDWMKKWKVKPNENKSVQLTFTTMRKTCPPLNLNGAAIPQSDDTKYLGMHLDRRLTWKKHILTKRKSLVIKLRNLFSLLDRKSVLSINNKLLLYNCILKPVWTYGSQLWGTASKSNVEIMQRFQSKVLRLIAKAPWYIPNRQIHLELEVPFVTDAIRSQAEKYRERLSNHPNELALNLMSPSTKFTRLKRKVPRELNHI